jgi:uncharacterized protein YwgA
MRRGTGETLSELSVLAGILAELSRVTSKSYDTSTFDSRLRIQKSIYLLGALGVPEAKSYSFSYYLRGPYSSSLAKDYYALEKNPTLNPKTTVPHAQIEIVKECVEKGSGFLEAVSTLHSIAEGNKNHSADEIINHARRLKPYLNFHLTEAWQFLLRHRLVQQRDT